MSQMQTAATGAAGGASSAGQSLPGGNISTSSQSPAATLAGPSPSGQFASDALAFLTALQDPRSAAAAAAQSTASYAMNQGVGALNSALDTLTQALNGASSTASSAASQLTGVATTASAAASSMSLSTASTLIQSLDQMMSSAGGHHHHLHGGGDAGGAAQADGWSSTAQSGAASTASSSASPMSLFSSIIANVAQS